MFDDKSRYRNAALYAVRDRRGRTVRAVAVPDPPAEERLGFHLRREGERLDHLAAGYLQDDAGYWRICELADVMLPEALSEALEIPIPNRSRR